MSSASSLPIHPPSLALPLLTVPTTTTMTSSQDEIVLDVNPPSLERQRKQKPAKKPCIPFYLVARKAQDWEKPSQLRKYWRMPVSSSNLSSQYRQRDDTPSPPSSSN
jgi:hypothetical protein